MPAVAPESTPRSVRVLLFGLTAIAFLLRLAEAPRSHGIDWDGVGYLEQSEHLGAVLSGTFPSVLGARGPFLYPSGLPVLLRLVALVAGSTRDAGLVLSIGAGTALVPVSFLLGRHLRDEVAGILAATIVALDPTLLEQSGMLRSEPLFSFLLWAGVLPLVAPRLTRGSGFASAALLTLAASVRSIGLPVAVVLVLLNLRGRSGDERRAARTAAVTTLIGVVLVGAIQWLLEQRNGAVPYWRTVCELATWEAGLNPRFFDVDAAGTSIRHATERTDLIQLLRDRPALILGIPVASAIAGLRALLPHLVVVPWAWKDRTDARPLVPLAAVAIGFLVPLCLLQYSTYMVRMLTPFQPGLIALAASGVVALAARTRLAPLARRPGFVALAAGLVCCITGSPLRHAADLPGLRSERSPRALADAFAAAIARAVPPTERIIRGPGGDPCLVALAGRLHVTMPATGHAGLEHFCDGNGLHWIIYAPAGGAELAFAPRRLTPVVVAEGQVLASIEH